MDIILPQSISKYLPDLINVPTFPELFFFKNDNSKMCSNKLIYAAKNVAFSYLDISSLFKPSVDCEVLISRFMVKSHTLISTFQNSRYLVYVTHYFRYETAGVKKQGINSKETWWIFINFYASEPVQIGYANYIWRNRESPERVLFSFSRANINVAGKCRNFNPRQSRENPGLHFRLLLQPLRGGIFEVGPYVS